MRHCTSSDLFVLPPFALVMTILYLLLVRQRVTILSIILKRQRGGHPLSHLERQGVVMNSPIKRGKRWSCALLSREARGGHPLAHSSLLLSSRSEEALSLLREGREVAILYLLVMRQRVTILSIILEGQSVAIHSIIWRGKG